MASNLTICSSSTFSHPASDPLIFYSAALSISAAGLLYIDDSDPTTLRDNDPDEDPPTLPFMSCHSLSPTHYVALTRAGDILSIDTTNATPDICSMGAIPDGIMCSTTTPTASVLLLLTSSFNLLGLTPPTLDSDGDHVGCDPIFETATTPPPPNSTFSLTASASSVLLLTSSPSLPTVGTHYDTFSGLPTTQLRSHTSSNPLANRDFSTTTATNTPTPLHTTAIPFLSPHSPSGAICTGTTMHTHLFVSYTYNPRLPTPYSLTTIEPNGLQHHSYPLPPATILDTLRSVSVSPTGEYILLASSSPTHTLLSVLYRDNYTYFTKFQRRLASPLRHAEFTPSADALTLTVITDAFSTALTLTSLPPFHSPTQSHILADHTLKTASFARGLRPPPLFDASFPAVSGVTAVSADAEIYADTTNAVFRIDSPTTLANLATLPQAPEQIAYQDATVAYTHPSPSNLNHTSLSLHPSTSPIFTSPSITCLTSFGSSFFFQADDAIYTCSSDSSPPALLMHLLEPLILATPLSATHVLGLTSTGRLYCNDTLLSPNASSYAVSHHHNILAFTTTGSRPKLLFKHISSLLDADEFDEVEPPSDLPDLSMERNVEPGSTLLAILTSPSVILRLPRGNLEGVHPRLLVLAHVRRLIDGGFWRRAYDTCRRMRVDFNLLVDYKPVLFMDSINDIIGLLDQEAIQKIVMMLQNVDFTLSKYPDPLALPPPDAVPSPFFESKTNKVCSTLRHSMLNLPTPGPFLLPILSTFAKQTPPDLAAALNLVKQQAEGKLNDALAQDCFKYLAFIAKYETIYSEALGMYDWDLARAVARNSQMDPRKYLPEVERFKLMDQGKAKLIIDKQLGRWESAVRHGTVADEKTECFEIIEKQGLVKLGLELFTSSEDRKALWGIIGRKLKKEGKSRAAIDAFLSIGEVNEAADIAKYSGDWEIIFTYIGELTYEGEAVELADLVEEVVDILATGENHATARAEKLGAAKILIEYGKMEGGLERAAKLLCEGCWFGEAVRVSKMGGVRDQVYQDVLESCRNFARTTASSLEERAIKFATNHERFVQIKKILEEKAILNPKNEYGGDGMESEFSVATSFSNASLNSVSSTGSTGSTKSYSSAYSGQTSKFEVKRAMGDLGGSGKGNKSQREVKKIKDRERRDRKKAGKKMRPGSVEEKNYVEGVMKSLMVGEGEAASASECLGLLVRCGEAEGLGARLFEVFEEFRVAVESKAEGELLVTTKLDASVEDVLSQLV